MDAATARPTAAPSRRVYIDFVPTHDLLQEEEKDTYVIHLVGFKKEQLKVEITDGGSLVTTGERFLAENRWSRFRKEFQVPKNCKVSEIGARFENGLLSIMLPKSVLVRGKGEPAKGTSSRKVEDAIDKKEDRSLTKRERSSTRKAREEKEKEEKGKKEKESEKVQNNDKDKKDRKEKEGTLSEVESLTERIKQKMREMDFETYLQPKSLIIGLALATVVSVGWYLHHRLTSTPESGEQHPNI